MLLSECRNVVVMVVKDDNIHGKIHGMTPGQWIKSPSISLLNNESHIKFLVTTAQSNESMTFSSHRDNEFVLRHFIVGKTHLETRVTIFVVGKKERKEDVSGAQ